MGLQFAKDWGALSPTVTEDTGHGELSVFVHDALWISTEEGECCVVTVAECLGNLCRIGLHKAPIAVGQING